MITDHMFLSDSRLMQFWQGMDGNSIVLADGVLREDGVGFADNRAKATFNVMVIRRPPCNLRLNQTNEDEDTRLQKLSPSIVH